MNHKEQQHAYTLDIHLHPEGRPWEWWEKRPYGKVCFSDLNTHPVWHEDAYYRRKDTAPNWDEELSPKEVAECDYLPSAYEVAVDDGYVAILYCGAEIWNNKEGWLYESKCDNEILDHFKKRRETILQRMPVVDEYCDKEQQAARDLQEVTKRDHKPSKDEILRDEAIARFTEKATSKFNAGIREHNPNGGNDLEDRATFADLEDEVIDLWFYVQGLKRRIHRT